MEIRVTERWQSYFAGHQAFGSGWLKTAVTHWSFHEVLYSMILRHWPPPARILDVGCGPGWSDCYLASAGYEVTGVDNEPRLVEHARDLALRLSVAARFETASAFDLSHFYGQYDLAYSCGVLEHFDREVTVRLLAEQAKCAPAVLIQIPTRYTAYTGTITDERIYTVGELKRIVEDAGLHVEAAFGYGDLTATRAHVFLRRFMPRGVWRWLQNRGFAFSIAVVGRKARSTVSVSEN
jgi:SAM-dependent methyltransferase